MRETNFIKQKKEKWIELERTMQQTHPDPEKLDNLFVQITDDLSYSRTFYPNRSVRVYLNGLAQQIFYSIYKNKKTSSRQFGEFWTKDLPLVMYQSRYELLLGMLLFWVPFVMGCLSGTMGAEEEFARQLMGNEYIDLTINNIQSGDPMAIYKDEYPFAMFLRIFLNNLWVSFRYFVLGGLFTIGSVVSLVFFGLYVGAFQYFFYEQGELLPSVLGIWTHGSIEIPAAILAGVGGIVLGKGLVFPGTYSRIQAFMISARKGIQIMIGVVPLILLAAIVESYLTRLTETPDAIRAGFITFNLTWILIYFVVWPYALGTKNFMSRLPLLGVVTLGAALVLAGGLFAFGIPSPLIILAIAAPCLFYAAIKSFDLLGMFESKPVEQEEEKLQPERNTKLRFDLIKSAGEIFKDVFIVYRKYLGKIIGVAFGTAGIFLAGILLFATGKPTDLFAYPAEFAGFMEDLFYFTFGGMIEESKYIGQFFDYKKGFLSPHFIVNNIVYSVLAFTSLSFVKDTYHDLNNPLSGKTAQTTRIFDFLKVATIVFLANLQLLAGEIVGFFNFSFVLTFPFMLLWAAICVLEDKNIFNGLSRTFELFFTKMGNSILLYIILGVITMMALALVFSPIVLLLLQNFGYNIATSQDIMDELVVTAVTFLAQAMFGMIFPIVVMGFGLLYYSQVEIRDAKSLFERIQTIGTGKRIRGLQREG